jgi:N-terminal acetyltransferase B complex non-catalytic subunit
MTLRKFTGTPMLPDCKTYWEHHSSLITCFADLRPFVEDMTEADRREFHEFAQTHAKEMGVSLGSDQVCMRFAV